MARKTRDLIISEDGEDMAFVIKQMPATQAESWLARVALLVLGSSAQVPDSAGIGEATKHLVANGLGALSGLSYDKVKPLYDELLSCIDRVLPDGTVKAVDVRTIDGYISNPASIIKMRFAAFEANIDFFGYGETLTSLKANALKAVSPSMQTSQVSAES